MLRALLVVAITAAWVAPAAAYEFEMRARTIGQGAELRAFRLLGPDVLASHRRFTQTLSLDIWDLGGKYVHRTRHGSQVRRGPNIYLTTYMRVDHDFGAWTSGSLLYDNRLRDAIDLVPELDSRSIQLEVLYGYFAVEGLADGAIDLYAGRLLEIDDLAWWSMDGVKARYTLPVGLAVEAFGGARVRDSSPLGSPTFEPDGTGSAECAEYAEGAVPGSGSWRPIDLGVPVAGGRFDSDLDVCPQREQLMPTFGGAVATSGLDRVWARVSYRRSQSPSPGIIGAPDRLDFEDVGFYPADQGQDPGWGVNEELVTASVRAMFRSAGARVTPYAAVRYSVLHGLIDEAHAGARLARGSHTLEPELYYSFPTFDGDSIFNVFAVHPYRDARVTYELTPRRSPWMVFGRAWLRQWDLEEGDLAEQPAPPEAPAQLSGGVQTGVRYAPDRVVSTRLDLFYDDGYGGRRLGGYASGVWQARRDLELALRLSLIDHVPDIEPALEATSAAVQLGASYTLHPGVVLHGVVEESHNRYNRSQLRVIGVLDLAFDPET